MKLYSLKLSHYAARVRIALILKGLEAEEVPPPVGGMKEGLQSAEYLAINPNPLGRVPCLVTGDGAAIGESTVILEYLDEAYPDPPLMPATPAERARVRLANRVGELYVAAPMQVLLWQTNPANRVAAEVETQLARMDKGLGWLEEHIDGGPCAVGGAMTLADCVLPTMLRIVPDFARVFEAPWLADNHPKAMDYLAQVREHPAVARVMAEMSAASATFRTTGMMT
jgi:glutathione S-transferase